MHFRIDRRDEPVAGELLREDGIDVAACDQTGLCTAVCPVSHAFDYLPHQVVRLAQLDQHDRLEHIAAPWVCTLCGACTESCPRQVDVGGLMAALRRRTRRAGAESPPEAETIRAATEAFLGVLEARGRVAPISLVFDYKLRSADLWSDLSLALPWFHGRLSLRGPGRPARTPEMPEVRRRPPSDDDRAAGGAGAAASGVHSGESGGEDSDVQPSSARAAELTADGVAAVNGGAAGAAGLAQSRGAADPSRGES